MFIVIGVVTHNHWIKKLNSELEDAAVNNKTVNANNQFYKFESLSNDKEDESHD